MGPLNLDTANILRHIAQHKIDIHPFHSKEKREALAALFELGETEMECLDALIGWIASHGLRIALENQEAQDLLERFAKHIADKYVLCFEYGGMLSSEMTRCDLSPAQLVKNFLVTREGESNGMDWK